MKNCINISGFCRHLFCSLFVLRDKRKHPNYLLSMEEENNIMHCKCVSQLEKMFKLNLNLK